MTTITIDQTKCIGCGQCVNDCFPKNLRLEDGKAVVGGPCMECGHCYAVCPTGAVQMEGYSTDAVIDCQGDYPVADGDALLNTIKMRRSIRQYKEQPVENDLLEKILEAGRFTPTGGNVQDVTYTVVQNDLDDVKKMFWDGFEPALDQMAQQLGQDHRYVKILRHLYQVHEASPDNDGLFINAPVLLIISGASLLDVGLAASRIELMAHAEGLGALFTGFVRAILASNAALCDKLQLQPAQIGVCMLMGYPAVTYQRTAPRKEAEVKWF